MAEVRIGGYRLSDTDTEELQAIIGIGLRKSRRFLSLTEAPGSVSEEYRQKIAKRCDVVKRIQDLIDEPPAPP